MSSNFLVFDANKTGMMTDGDYAVSAYRADGVQVGIAPRDIHNKLYYQLSVFIAAMAEDLSDRGFAVSDASFSNLKAILNNIALKSDMLSGGWKAGQAFVVGEIIYPTNILYSPKRMECVQSGTSGTVEPTWGNIGTLVTDGTAKWIIDDVRDMTPVGRSVLEHLATPRAGYLAMSGQLVNRADYPRLWAFANASGLLVTEAQWSGGQVGAFSSGNLSTTFRLPDGRAEFFRGWDNSRGTDAGRVLGSEQLSANLAHSHTIFTRSTTNIQHDTSVEEDKSVLEDLTSSSGSSGGTEARPRNIALLACIKY